jgi:large subunit ribosomal protein L21
MKYAIVSHSGKQYKVAEGDILELDSLSKMKPQEDFTLPVLLLVDEKTRKIGTPTVPNVKVVGTVIQHKKEKKIRIAKYKAKVRYRRVKGFRAKVTSVKITNIG